MYVWYNAIGSLLNCIQLHKINFIEFRFLIIIGKNVFISQLNCLRHGDSYIFLTFLFQIPIWYLWLTFCYLYSSLPVPVLITLCHSLLLCTYFKSYLSTAWSQQVIHGCWICYIAISNIQQLYISVSVSCDTKEHQYTFRTASYSGSHSHTAISYIAISNIQQLYIYISVCVTWHKGTSVYISYCQLQQVTQPYFKPTISSYWLSVVCRLGTTRNSVQWQPIYRREFIWTN